MRRNMLFLRGSMACGQALCLWCDHLLVQLSAQELHFYDQCTNIYLLDFGLVIVTRVFTKQSPLSGHFLF